MAENTYERDCPYCEGKGKETLRLPDPEKTRKDILETFQEYFQEWKNLEYQIQELGKGLKQTQDQIQKEGPQFSGEFAEEVYGEFEDVTATLQEQTMELLGAYQTLELLLNDLFEIEAAPNGDS